MKAFLLHVGVSPYNTKLLPMADPCFCDSSFIFVPWCTGDDKYNEEAPMQTEYQYLTHPFGLKELLRLHPIYGSRMICFKTQNNPEFINFTFGEWLPKMRPNGVKVGAKRTERLFPLMSIGDKVYFIASFVKIDDIPSLKEFVLAPERYKVPINMCFSKHLYSKKGFIGVFAHFTIEEILGSEKYLKRYRNAQKFEGSRWNSQGRDDVLIKGSKSESNYWNRIVPIGKGNEPTEDFKPLYEKGRIAKWSGWFDETATEQLQLYFQRHSVI